MIRVSFFPPYQGSPGPSPEKRSINVPKYALFLLLLSSFHSVSYHPYSTSLDGHPCPTRLRSELPDGWIQLTTQSGKEYYYNAELQKTQV